MLLNISSNVASAFQAEGLRALRLRILAHWADALPGAAARVGEPGRNAILADIDALARDDRDLSISDLIMLADLALTRAANELRAAPPAQSPPG